MYELPVKDHLKATVIDIVLLNTRLVHSTITDFNSFLMCVISYVINCF